MLFAISSIAEQVFLNFATVDLNVLLNVSNEGLSKVGRPFSKLLLIFNVTKNYDWLKIESHFKLPYQWTFSIDKAANLLHVVYKLLKSIFPSRRQFFLCFPSSQNGKYLLQLCCIKPISCIHLFFTTR